MGDEVNFAECSETALQWRKVMEKVLPDLKEPCEVQAIMEGKARSVNEIISEGGNSISIKQMKDFSQIFCVGQMLGGNSGLWKKYEKALTQALNADTNANGQLSIDKIGKAVSSPEEAQSIIAAAIIARKIDTEPKSDMPAVTSIPKCAPAEKNIKGVDLSPPEIKEPIVGFWTKVIGGVVIYSSLFFGAGLLVGKKVFGKK